MGLFNIFKSSSSNGHFDMPYFGKIDPNNLQESYDLEIELEDDQKIQLDLNFESKATSSELLSLTADFLNDIESEAEEVYEYLMENPDEYEAIDEYLEHHLEELNDEVIAELTVDADKELTRKEQLAGALQLVRIGIYPEDDEEFAIFDYTISSEHTNYLLVVTLNKERTVEDVNWES